MVRDLAFAASNKAQKIDLKQAAALKRYADTKFTLCQHQIFKFMLLLYASQEKS
jgi:hypothetical protein